MVIIKRCQRLVKGSSPLFRTKIKGFSMNEELRILDIFNDPEFKEHFMKKLNRKVLDASFWEEQDIIQRESAERIRKEQVSIKMSFEKYHKPFDL